MKNFEFRNPTKIKFGKNTISEIGEEIIKHGVKKILLLYGQGSIFKNGVYDTTVVSLQAAGIEWFELGSIKPNPVLSKAYEGIKLCKEERIDGILAVGGGSVIDSAKVIAAGALYDGDIWNVFEGNDSVNESLPVFTILTLSATASEMDPYAVITKEDEKKKWSFSAGQSSYPKVSIIDPTVQFSLPKEQTVNGAVDAMSHIFELYFSGTSDTDVQDEIAEGIIRTIITHTKILLEQPDNYESRAQLIWCATLALNGINGVGRNGGDWATHTIEHSISAYYDIAHGAGLAIMFPAWMKYVYKEDLPKFSRFAERVFGIKKGTEEVKAQRGIEALKSFYKEIGAPITLKEIGVTENDLQKLADNASMREPEGKLKELYRKDILKIYRLAYE
ncbi:MAG: butanol dehydrogenase [Ignavibacteria bacterium RBG_13_36_8]|nr:MAG: butanol dehydrogenase [Ignavibacteria bacterium RBG_13_36_8]